MVVERITFTDYNDVERTESYTFNISRAELIEWERDTEGGLDTKLQRIVDSKDPKELVRLFTDVLERAYGVKSDDGRRIRKSKELWTEFKESEAYSELIVKFIQNPDYAATFVNNVIPKIDSVAAMAATNLSVVK